MAEKFVDVRLSAEEAELIDFALDLVSDAYADQGVQSIRWALLTAMVTFLLGALCFWRASRPYARAVAAAKPSGD